MRIQKIFILKLVLYVCVPKIILPLGENFDEIKFIDGLHYLLEALCISNINLFEKSGDKNFLKSTINMNFSIFPSKNVVESFDGKFKSFDRQWGIKI